MPVRILKQLPPLLAAPEVAGAGLVHVLGDVPATGACVLSHRDQLDVGILATVLGADPRVKGDSRPHDRTYVRSPRSALQSSERPFAGDRPRSPPCLDRVKERGSGSR